MLANESLYLYEEVLLLALRDDKGTGQFTFELPAGAAILAELLLAGRLRIEGERSNARVFVAAPGPLGDPLLDECLERVAVDAKPRRPVHWVAKFAHIKRLKHRAAERLVDRRILRAEQDRVLLFFERTLYPELDGRPERELERRIKDAVTGSVRDVEPRTIALIALVKHTGQLQQIVGRRTLRDNKARLEALLAGELAAQSASEAVAAVQAAVMAAAVIPAVTSAVT